MSPSPRQSNIELLRIIAMLMVLTLHATFETFGYARIAAIQHAPLRWLGIISAAAASMVCVDTFVFITGWFGTRFRLQGVVKLVGECTFIALSMFGVLWLLGYQLPTHLFDFLKSIWSYWFVRAYLLLYLFTPVLNRFVDESSERQLRNFLICYLIISIPHSFVSSDTARGFSSVSFMGLYLMGRYLRLYLGPRLKRWPRRRFLGIYALCAFSMALLLWGSAFCSKSFHNWFVPVFTAYSNPFVMLGAACLLLYFSRLHFTSKTVNWLAAGSFAAYLTHQQCYVRTHYFELIRYIDQQVSQPVLCVLCVIGAVLIIYLLSALLDSVWRAIYSILNRKMCRKKTV